MSTQAVKFHSPSLPYAICSPYMKTVLGNASIGLNTAIAGMMVSDSQASRKSIEALLLDIDAFEHVCRNIEYSILPSIPIESFLTKSTIWTTILNTIQSFALSGQVLTVDIASPRYRAVRQCFLLMFRIINVVKEFIETRMQLVQSTKDERYSLAHPIYTHAPHSSNIVTPLSQVRLDLPTVTPLPNPAVGVCELAHSVWLSGLIFLRTPILPNVDRVPSPAEIVLNIAYPCMLSSLPLMFTHPFTVPMHPPPHWSVVADTVAKLLQQFDGQLGLYFDHVQSLLCDVPLNLRMFSLFLHVRPHLMPVAFMLMIATDAYMDARTRVLTALDSFVTSVSERTDAVCIKATHTSLLCTVHHKYPHVVHLIETIVRMQTISVLRFKGLAFLTKAHVASPQRTVLPQITVHISAVKQLVHMFHIASFVTSLVGQTSKPVAYRLALTRIALTAISLVPKELSLLLRINAEAYNHHFHALAVGDSNTKPHVLLSYVHSLSQIVLGLVSEMSRPSIAVIDDYCSFMDTIVPSVNPLVPTHTLTTSSPSVSGPKATRSLNGVSSSSTSSPSSAPHSEGSPVPLRRRSVQTHDTAHWVRVVNSFCAWKPAMYETAKCPTCHLQCDGCCLLMKYPTIAQVHPTLIASALHTHNPLLPSLALARTALLLDLLSNPVAAVKLMGTQAIVDVCYTYMNVCNSLDVTLDEVDMLIHAALEGRCYVDVFRSLNRQCPPYINPTVDLIAEFEDYIRGNPTNNLERVAYVFGYTVELVYLLLSIPEILSVPLSQVLSLRDPRIVDVIFHTHFLYHAPTNPPHLYSLIQANSSVIVQLLYTCLPSVFRAPFLAAYPLVIMTQVSHDRYCVVDPSLHHVNLVALLEDPVRNPVRMSLMATACPSVGAYLHNILGSLRDATHTLCLSQNDTHALQSRLNTLPYVIAYNACQHLYDTTVFGLDAWLASILMAPRYTAGADVQECGVELNVHMGHVFNLNPDDTLVVAARYGPVYTSPDLALHLPQPVIKDLFTESYRTVASVVLTYAAARATEGEFFDVNTVDGLIMTSFGLATLAQDMKSMELKVVALLQCLSKYSDGHVHVITDIHATVASMVPDLHNIAAALKRDPLHVLDVIFSNAVFLRSIVVLSSVGWPSFMLTCASDRHAQHLCLACALRSMSIPLLFIWHNVAHMLLDHTHPLFGITLVLYPLQRFTRVAQDNTVLHDALASNPVSTDPECMPFSPLSALSTPVSMLPHQHLLIRRLFLLNVLLPLSSVSPLNLSPMLLAVTFGGVGSPESVASFPKPKLNLKPETVDEVPSSVAIIDCTPLLVSSTTHPPSVHYCVPLVIPQQLCVLSVYRQATHPLPRYGLSHIASIVDVPLSLTVAHVPQSQWPALEKKGGMTYRLEEDDTVQVSWGLYLLYTSCPNFKSQLNDRLPLLMIIEPTTARGIPPLDLMDAMVMYFSPTHKLLTTNATSYNGAMKAFDQARVSAMILFQLYRWMMDYSGYRTCVFDYDLFVPDDSKACLVSMMPSSMFSLTSAHEREVFSSCLELESGSMTFATFARRWMRHHLYETVAHFTTLAENQQDGNKPAPDVHIIAARRLVSQSRRLFFSFYIAAQTTFMINNHLLHRFMRHAPSSVNEIHLLANIAMFTLICVSTPVFKHVSFSVTLEDLTSLPRILVHRVRTDAASVSNLWTAVKKAMTKTVVDCSFLCCHLMNKVNERISLVPAIQALRGPTADAEDIALPPIDVHNPLSTSGQLLFRTDTSHFVMTFTPTPPPLSVLDSLAHTELLVIMNHVRILTSCSTAVAMCLKSLPDPSAAPVAVFPSVLAVVKSNLSLHAGLLTLATRLADKPSMLGFLLPLLAYSRKTAETSLSIAKVLINTAWPHKQMVFESHAFLQLCLCITTRTLLLSRMQRIRTVGYLPASITSAAGIEPCHPHSHVDDVRAHMVVNFQDTPLLEDMLSIMRECVEWRYANSINKHFNDITVDATTMANARGSFANGWFVNFLHCHYPHLSTYALSMLRIHMFSSPMAQVMVVKSAKYNPPIKPSIFSHPRHSDDSNAICVCQSTLIHPSMTFPTCVLLAAIIVTKGPISIKVSHGDISEEIELCHDCYNPAISVNEIASAFACIISFCRAIQFNQACMGKHSVPTNIALSTRKVAWLLLKTLYPLTLPATVNPLTESNRNPLSMSAEMMSTLAAALSMPSVMTDIVSDYDLAIFYWQYLCSFRHVMHHYAVVRHKTDSLLENTFARPSGLRDTLNNMLSFFLERLETSQVFVTAVTNSHFILDITRLLVTLVLPSMHTHPSALLNYKSHASVEELHLAGRAIQLVYELILLDPKHTLSCLSSHRMTGFRSVVEKLAHNPAKSVNLDRQPDVTDGSYSTRGIQNMSMYTMLMHAIAMVVYSHYADLVLNPLITSTSAHPKLEVSMPRLFNIGRDMYFGCLVAMQLTVHSSDFVDCPTTVFMDSSLELVSDKSNILHIPVEACEPKSVRVFNYVKTHLPASPSKHSHPEFDPKYPHFNLHTTLYAGLHAEHGYHHVDGDLTPIVDTKYLVLAPSAVLCYSLFTIARDFPLVSRIVIKNEDAVYRAATECYSVLCDVFHAAKCSYVVVPPRLHFPVTGPFDQVYSAGPVFFFPMNTPFSEYSIKVTNAPGYRMIREYEGVLMPTSACVCPYKWTLYILHLARTYRTSEYEALSAGMSLAALSVSVVAALKLVTRAAFRAPDSVIHALLKPQLVKPESFMIFNLGTLVPDREVLMYSSRCCLSLSDSLLTLGLPALLNSVLSVCGGMTGETINQPVFDDPHTPIKQVLSLGKLLSIVLSLLHAFLVSSPLSKVMLSGGVIPFLSHTGWPSKSHVQRLLQSGTSYATASLTTPFCAICPTPYTPVDAAHVRASSTEVNGATIDAKKCTQHVPSCPNHNVHMMVLSEPCTCPLSTLAVFTYQDPYIVLLSSAQKHLQVSSYVLANQLDSILSIDLPIKLFDHLLRVYALCIHSPQSILVSQSAPPIDTLAKLSSFPASPNLLSLAERLVTAKKYVWLRSVVRAIYATLRCPRSRSFWILHVFTRSPVFLFSLTSIPFVAQVSSQRTTRTYTRDTQGNLVLVPETNDKSLVEQSTLLSSANVKNDIIAEIRSLATLGLFEVLKNQKLSSSVHRHCTALLREYYVNHGQTEQGSIQYIQALEYCNHYTYDTHLLKPAEPVHSPVCNFFSTSLPTSVKETMITKLFESAVAYHHEHTTRTMLPPPLVTIKAVAHVLNAEWGKLCVTLAKRLDIELVPVEESSGDEQKQEKDEDK